MEVSTDRIGVFPILVKANNWRLVQFSVNLSNLLVTVLSRQPQCCIGWNMSTHWMKWIWSPAVQSCRKWMCVLGECRYRASRVCSRCPAWRPSCLVPTRQSSATQGFGSWRNRLLMPNSRSRMPRLKHSMSHLQLGSAIMLLLLLLFFLFFFFFSSFFLFIFLFFFYFFCFLLLLLLSSSSSSLE